MIKSAKNEIVKGSALLGISAIIVKMIGVIYKVPLSYILGDEGMGYFNSAYTVYTLFFILSTAGVPKAISIIISKSEAESKNNSYTIMKTLSLFFLVIGLFVCILFYLLAYPISNLISNRGALFSMYVIAPSIPLLCSGGVLRGYLVGKMSFLPVAISEIISGASKLIFGLLFAVYSSNQGMSVTTISAYTIFGITLGSFLCMIPLLISVSKNKHKIASINAKSTIKEALKITLPITLSSALSGIAGVIDLTLIMRGLVASGYSETVATVIYGNYTTLAIPMFTLISTLIAQISTSLLPSLVQCGNSIDEKNKTIRFALFLSLFIALPGALYYFIYPKDVLGILFEEGSVALGSAFLASIAPSVLLVAPLTIINTTLEADGKIIVPVISLTIGSVIKLFTSAFLIGRSDFGILAASLGTFLSYLVPLVISGIYLYRKTPYRVSLIRCIIIPTIASSLSVICGLFIRPVLQTVGNERLNSLIFLLSVGFIYLILSAILSKNASKLCINMSK